MDGLAAYNNDFGITRDFARGPDDMLALSTRLINGLALGLFQDAREWAGLAKASCAVGGISKSLHHLINGAAKNLLPFGQRRLRAAFHLSPATQIFPRLVQQSGISLHLRCDQPVHGEAPLVAAMVAVNGLHKNIIAHAL